MTILALAWVLATACWAWLAYAVASSGAGRNWLGKARQALRELARETHLGWRGEAGEGRAGRVRRVAVSLWIITIFLGWSVSLGPADHVRASDLSALLLVAALAAGRRPLASVIPHSALVLLGMALWGILLIPSAHNRELATLGAAQLVELALVVVALVGHLGAATPRERRLYLNLFIAMSCAEAAIAVLQSLTKTGEANIATRGIGTLGLFVSYFLVAPFLYALWRMVVSTGHGRVAWTAVGSLLGLGLLASQTRSAWLAAFAGAFCMLFLHRRRLAVLSTAVVLIAALGASQLANALDVRVGVLARVDSVVQLAQGRTQEAGNWTLTTGRTSFWQASVETIEDEPMGIGLKNFRLTLPSLARERLPSNLDWSAEVEGPHNQYLFTTVELGVTGALLLFLLCCTAGVMVIRTRSSGRPFAIGLLVAVLIQAALGDILFGPLGMLTAGMLATLEFQWLRESSRVRVPERGADGRKPVAMRDLGTTFPPVTRSGS